MYETGLGATIAYNNPIATVFGSPTTRMASPWPTVTASPTMPRTTTTVAAPKPSYTDLLRKVATAPKAPTPTVPVRTVSPTMPVLKLPATTAKPSPSPAPALTPTSSGGGQVLTVGGGASSGPLVPEVLTMDADTGLKGTLAAFSKSPLPIIIFGILALALSEKGRK